MTEGRARLGVLLALGAALLFGCGGDPDQSTGKSSSNLGAGGVNGTGNSGATTIGITFTARYQGIAVAPQSFTVTEPHLTKGTLYYVLSASGPAVASVSSLTSSGANTRTATVYPASSAALGSGTFYGVVSLVACVDDPTCATGVLPKSSMTINVTYQVGGLIISPPGINFSSLEGTAPATQSLTISTDGASTPWTSAISYRGSLQNWLTVTPASDLSLPATLNFDAAAIPYGTYAATVTVSVPGANGNPMPLPIPVYYTVLPWLTLSTDVVALAAEKGQATLPASATVGVTGAGTATHYVATVNYYTANQGWLDVTGGALPGSLTLTPNTTNLPAATHSATVSLTPYDAANVAVGSALTVDVAYTVSVLSAAPAAVNWTHTSGSGSALPSQAVALKSVLPGTTTWISTVVYDSGTPGWLTSSGSGAIGSASDDTLSANASTYALSPGTYKAHVTYSDGTTTTAVAVTLVVK